MKNRLSDLNNHLFAQLERLSDESLTPEQLKTEAERAAAIVSVSDQIVGSATLQFKAAELASRFGKGAAALLPETITGNVIDHRQEPTRQVSNLTSEELERMTAEARRKEREEREMRIETARQRREGMQ